jgi:hypothetical protein
MPRPFEKWTVLPHEKLMPVEDEILTVVGEMKMPLGEIPRRMTIVRLADGGLVIYSAIALDDDEMKRIEAFGKPAWLVVPNDVHRTDAKIWKDRYPTMEVIAPPGARDHVDEVVRVDATAVDFADRRVRFVVVPGTDGHEAALEVETATGTTLVVNDLIWNVDDRPGFGGWIFHALGFTGPAPHMPGVIERRTVKDPQALRRQLESWAALPDLNRIIVSHGTMLVHDPKQVLRDLAAKLETH